MTGLTPAIPEQNLKWLEHLPTGWHGLYRGFVEQLASAHPEAIVDQARQKFGKLRIYLNHHAGAAAELCYEVEEASATKCELCGKAARLLVDKHGWYRTLCLDDAEGFKPPPPKKR